MFRAKGYDFRKVILDTPRTAVKKIDEKKTEKEVLEEPKPNKTGKILTEEVKAEPEVVEEVAPVEAEQVSETVVVEDKPKKKTSKKKSE